MVNPAVELRCKELVAIHLQAASRRSEFTLDQLAALHQQFTGLLVEISTGQTILVPNKRQRAEALQLTKENSSGLRTGNPD